MRMDYQLIDLPIHRCAALPLVNSAGTSIACTTQSDLDSRIAATGAKGGNQSSSQTVVGAGTTKSQSAVANAAAKETSTKTSSASKSSSTSKGASGGDTQTSLTLDPSVIASGFAQNGQATQEAGQVASLTSKNNYINFCATTNQALTNGQQVTGGSCNPAPMGSIPSTTNMPSCKFSNPKNMDTISENTPFNVTMNIINMETGNFVNAQSNYFSAPQQLNSQGQIIGHSHIVIEELTSMTQTTPTDPTKFAFFLGLNAAADNGVLTAPVTKGLPAGTYKLTSINTAANHQPVLVPIAQHGSTEDVVYFTVKSNGKSDSQGAGYLSGNLRFSIMSLSDARSFTLRIPATSANIGPGFDVVGLSLSLYVTLTVTISPPTSESPPRPPVLSYSGEGALEVPLNPWKNLTTRVALYLLRCNNIRNFPTNTKIHVDNEIPFGRGLGSSGAAVIAGVLLGNEVGRLNLPVERLLDFALMVERHPDNVTAALVGGFVGSYLRELDPAATEAAEVPLSEVLPEYPQDAGEEWGLHPPAPPVGIGHYVRFGWSKSIKAVAIIPRFELSTAKAREVLPLQYSRKDLVFNMQRLAVLTTALGQSPPDPDLIYEAMKDRVHQPYRKLLIPGLPEVTSNITPATHPGLLGICLSGAGPTILALATGGFEAIAEDARAIFKKEGIEVDWKLLEVVGGSTVEHN
ncbi:hypothetical protein HWV62_38699 [Athelia sp. TMB]|nr:hypothetical protein HWV62_38699 [Athelia sp. TMB]